MLLWCQMEVTKCRKHLVRCHLAAISWGNLGTGFACIVGIPQSTEREKQKWQEGAESNLGLSNERERLLSSKFISGSKHTVWHVIILLTRLDSLLPCRIPALITRQEEKYDAREYLSYTRSNNTSGKG